MKGCSFVPVNINNVSLVYSSFLQLSHELTCEHTHSQYIHLHQYDCKQNLRVWLTSSISLHSSVLPVRIGAQ